MTSPHSSVIRFGSPGRASSAPTNRYGCAAEKGSSSPRCASPAQTSNSSWQPFPHTAKTDPSHAGLDILYVLEGSVVLRLDDTDYPMTAGECVVWPSSHEHAIRNDSDEPARAIGLVTETVY